MLFVAKYASCSSNIRALFAITKVAKSPTTTRNRTTNVVLIFVPGHVTMNVHGNLSNLAIPIIVAVSDAESYYEINQRYTIFYNFHVYDVNLL